jgi:hypothetical protein
VVDVAVQIEVIMERSVGRNEFLQIAHPSKSRHGPLSSSEGQVRVFRSVVQVATDLLAVLVPDLFHGSSV